jgi:hypothetical protein
MYQSALATFRYQFSAVPEANGQSDGAFVDAMRMTGLVSDELSAGDLGRGNSLTPRSPSVFDQIDARVNLAGVDNNFITAVYEELQGVRNTDGLAIGMLAAYADSAPAALQARLYAQTGYAEILLADLFCSGVPLSTIDFQKEYTYRAGSATTDIYHDAITQFTTALGLATDSAEVQQLAWLGQARAYLNLGQYDSAAAAAAHVPDGFTFQFPVDWANVIAVCGVYTNVCDQYSGNHAAQFGVADVKGGNGLPFRSGGDPRTASEPGLVGIFGDTMYVPLKYGGVARGTHPITVADGIEARLIQAEAAWHGVATGTGTWLEQLNAARARQGLPSDLTDPGSPDAQVDLIFRERAAAMFLTGHRLGDLRRLVRNYHRNMNTVFPVGQYPQGTSISSYGTAASLLIPMDEFINPLFHGCLSLGA